MVPFSTSEITYHAAAPSRFAAGVFDASGTLTLRFSQRLMALGTALKQSETAQIVAMTPLGWWVVTKNLVIASPFTGRGNLGITRSKDFLYLMLQWYELIDYPILRSPCRCFAASSR